MCASKPFDVSREMVRAARPDGRIVRGYWIPGNFNLVAQILKISSAYTAAPPKGFISPVFWGWEEQVTSRYVQGWKKKILHEERILFF